MTMEKGSRAAWPPESLFSAAERKPWPAVHGLDGAVSFILEWNGLKFVYGSDTVPNKWYVEHAAGADVAVHECFLPPTLLVEKQGFTPGEALQVGTQGHTSPEQFGKVMSLVKPRLAVGYHFYNDHDTEPEVRDRVRKTYNGPLSLAVDYMVWNVTKDEITERMAVVDHHSWNPPAAYKPIPVKPEDRVGYSPEIEAGRWNVDDVLKPINSERCQ